jgi:hypothetical protein
MAQAPKNMFTLKRVGRTFGETANYLGILGVIFSLLADSIAKTFLQSGVSPDTISSVTTGVAVIPSVILLIISGIMFVFAGLMAIVKQARTAGSPTATKVLNYLNGVVTILFIGGPSFAAGLQLNSVKNTSDTAYFVLVMIAVVAWLVSEILTIMGLGYSLSNNQVNSMADQILFTWDIVWGAVKSVAILLLIIASILSITISGEGLIAVNILNSIALILASVGILVRLGMGLFKARMQAIGIYP